MFEKIREWYEEGRWSKKRVRSVVAKGTITPQEYELITGEPYEA